LQIHTQKSFFRYSNKPKGDIIPREKRILERKHPEADDYKESIVKNFPKPILAAVLEPASGA
jgi:hypothetical protein